MAAIDLYRRALSQNYREVGWRLNLAHALAETGQLQDAIHEVRIVLRLRPQNPGATRLLEELLSRAETAPPKSLQSNGTCEGPFGD